MPKKILIVDDESHIRLLLEQTLEDIEEKGAVLLMADNGEAALEIIKTERPGLVFMDVMMPKMNGFDVCRTVKKDLGMQDVHIVLLTAKGQEYDKQRGIEVGADMYITKPFNPDDIVLKASTVLGL
ncbi:MAG: response regulator [Deltaproteobacteria bacterium]|nr:response regulator [Deltaproteobacteria bacterium]